MEDFRTKLADAWDNEDDATFSKLLSKSDIPNDVKTQLADAWDSEDDATFGSVLSSLGEVAQKPYTPPINEAWKSGDPQEMAWEISQREGVPFAEAMELVAGNPRTAKSLLEGNNVAPISRLFDATSAIGRGAKGLYAMATGGDPLDAMAQTSAPDRTGVMGNIGEFAENVAIDPLTPLSLGTGAIAKTAVTKFAPNLGRFVAGALSGGGAGALEYGLEQGKRLETNEDLQGVGDFALQVGGGGLLSGGADALGGIRQARKELKEAPSILRSEVSQNPFTKGASGFSTDPIKVEQKMLEDVMANTGFSMNEVKSLPIYSRDMFANIDEEGKKQLQKYISLGRIANGKRSEITPYHEVGKMFLAGEEAINQARKQAGQKMGEIESQYLQGGAIDTAPLKKRWAELLEEWGGMVKGEDGTFKSAPNRSRASKPMRAEFEDADEVVSELGDFVTGEGLRDLEMALAEITPGYASTRSGKMNSKADAGINSFISDARELITERIRENGGDEALDAYRKAKSDYGKYWQAQDFAQRRLGLTIEDDAGEEISTRGASMVKAMMNSTDDRNTASLARMMRDLNGQDIGKQASMAKFAMEVADDNRAGSRTNMNELSKSGLLTKFIDWVGDKTVNRGHTPMEFEPMTNLVSQIDPNKPMSVYESAMGNKYAQGIGDTFQNYLGLGGRASIRSLTNDESNKVTDNKLNEIGEAKIQAGTR